MAGHLFYLGLASRSPGQSLQPRVFTGASAGAINSLVASMNACLDRELNPMRSLYWDVWIPVGVNQLFTANATGSTGMLSTDAYGPVIERMRTLWDAGLPRGCEIFLGITMTRAIARSVVLAPGLPPLPRSRESLLLKVSGRGPGTPPVVQNVGNPYSPAFRMLLPVDGPDADPFAAIMRAIFASAAVPFAFPPVSVPHCLSDRADQSRCTPLDAQTALFIDGSIFDNQPLGLAVRAMRVVGMDRDGERTIPDGARFYFLDPQAFAYPIVSEAEKEREPDGAIGVARLLLGMVDNDRSGDLVAVFEQEPTMTGRLLVGRTFFPQISNAFTGMVERSFREFDFYLGMYNAARSLREHPLGNDAPGVEVAILNAGDEALAVGWRPFFCLRAVLDGDGDVSVCDGDDLADFRILLQVSIDQMADQCRRAAQNGVAPVTDHIQCRAAMLGDSIALVPGVPRIEAGERWTKGNEDPLDYQLRLLGLYRFHFKDLGLRREDARHARDQLIRLSQAMVHDFAQAQPGDRTALSILGRVGVDVALGYVAPRHSFHASLGLGGEIGYSVAVAGPTMKWLRFGIAVGFDGLSSLFSSADTYFAFVPKAGPEFEIIGRPLAQVRVGLRGGYQFSTIDSFGNDQCDGANEALQPCSRVVTELFTSVSLLGVVRFQLGGFLEPKLRDDQQTLFSLRPTIGIQFNSPF